jgi:hypothetical protein
MPRETFGGDDEGDEGEEVKKLDLSKYGLAPDVNIRDTFWKIMASYATAKKPGVDLSTLEQDRFALMRVALSVLSRPHHEEYGLAPKFTARYTMMMILDAGWGDVLGQFIEKGQDTPSGNDVRNALRNVLSQDRYREELTVYFTKMLRGRGTVEATVSFLAELKDPDLARAMKKELVILARGDIGTNQLNAIRVISLIREDETVKKSLLALLTHWDEDARLAAANALEGMEDGEVKEAAKRRLKRETSGEVIKVLERIAE